MRSADKISWKYALGLDLDDVGFDASVVSEFRTRVAEHGLEQRVLDLLLEALTTEGLVAAGGMARTDSTHVISAVRDLNRWELAGESVRACLEAVAAVAPDWLPTVIDVADWGRRYGARVDTWRLPTSKTKRAELAAAYGTDAVALLCAIGDSGAPPWLRELPAVEVLRRVLLVQNYLITTDATGREVIRAREADTDGLPPGRTRLSYTLISPLLADQPRQAKAGSGDDRASFTIDFDTEQARCPQGKTSTWWSPATQRGTDAIVIKFAAATCRDCPVHDQCTRSVSPRVGRQLTVPAREVHQTQLAARATQDTPDWQARYTVRAGVEGTIRQGIAVTGMRRARYRGLSKTRLEHVFSAVALNLIRLDAYRNGRPLDRTRTSHLAASNSPWRPDRINQQDRVCMSK